MNKVIEIMDLSVSFTQNKEVVKAVQNSNFFINRGECFSIVGESGSGKSVTAMSMMKLLKKSNNTLISGFIKFEEENLLIAGDTLFQSSFGRTDLWGGDFNTIETSIREVLYKLDEATTVITGHGASTTIGREIRTNAFVRG